MTNIIIRTFEPIEHEPRILGFHAPTKMFYDLWAERGDRAIDESDRTTPTIHDLVANQRDEHKLAILDEELTRLGLERNYLNANRQWSLVPIGYEVSHE